MSKKQSQAGTPDLAYGMEIYDGKWIDPRNTAPWLCLKSNSILNQLSDRGPTTIYYTFADLRLRKSWSAHCCSISQCKGDDHEDQDILSNYSWPIWRYIS